MKITYRLFLSSLVLYSLNSYSQEQKPENYTQKIAGSELTIDMVGIPAGEFLMGSPVTEKQRLEDEGPQHKVKLDAFWMSSHEITWELYDLYLQRSVDDVNDPNKSKDIDHDIDAVAGATIPYVDMSLGMGKGAGLPIGNVTPLAASKFCEWLSAKTGHFYRLPTEAEWEYAARAGSQTAYHFGDDPSELGEYAWYMDNSDDHYHKIGQKKPNPWGLYDMYGNVAEWTLDQYVPDAYSKRKKVAKNPHEVATEPYPWSLRGGSYYDPAEYLRSASRYGSTENWRMRDPQFPKSLWWNTDAPFVGFRIVRDPTPPSKADYEKYWGVSKPSK